MPQQCLADGDSGQEPSGEGGVAKAAEHVAGGDMAAAATARGKEAVPSDAKQTAAAAQAASVEEEEVYEAEYAAMMADMHELISREVCSPADNAERGGGSGASCLGYGKRGSSIGWRRDGRCPEQQQQQQQQIQEEGGSCGVDGVEMPEEGSCYDGAGDDDDDDDDDASSSGLGETQALVSKSTLCRPALGNGAYSSGFTVAFVSLSGFLSLIVRLLMICACSDQRHVVLNLKSELSNSHVCLTAIFSDPAPIRRARVVLAIRDTGSAAVAFACWFVSCMWGNPCGRQSTKKQVKKNP